MDTPTSAQPPAAAVSEDKTVAILAYITIIGFIVALVMHSSKKTQLGAFHLRQCLGLFLTGIVLGIIPLLNLVAFVFLFVLWILGLISAVNGQQKPMPVLGPLYAKWFAGVFN